MKRDWRVTLRRSPEQGLACFPVSRYYEGMENILLLAFTEKRTKEEIDIMVAKLESALGA